ncbi:hypothetical protein J2S51_006570 [Streptomyces sp. DSM 41269]|nr:hypothetical protein [Streptomyces sp. DSM 41269]
MCGTSTESGRGDEPDAPWVAVVSYENARGCPRPPEALRA